MPLSAPISVSRDNSDYALGQDWREFGKVLGKREHSPSEGANGQARQKRMAVSARTNEEDPSNRQQYCPRELENSYSESHWSGDEQNEHEGKQDKRVKLDQNISLPSRQPRARGAPSASDTVLSPSHAPAAHRIVRRHSLPTLLAGEVDVMNKDTDVCQNAEYRPCNQRWLRKLGFPRIYSISCMEFNKRSRHHPTFFFEDDPLTANFTEVQSSSHLTGHKPIFQLQDYVQQFQQPSFVIITNRVCRNLANFTQEGEKRSESMLILDNSLRQAIQKVATYPLERRREPSGHDRTPELLEMPAPYQFLYLHRESLLQYAQSAAASLRTVIEAVVQYIETNYAAEYKESEELMSRGKINWRHVDKLFRPNQLVTHCPQLGNINHHEETIYVVDTWPVVQGNILHLDSWEWVYGGWSCTRRNFPNLIYAPTEDEDELFDITKLELYPMRFLSTDKIVKIRKRGKQAWNLRLPSFVHYHKKNYTQGRDHAKPGRYMIDHWMYHNLHNKSTYFPENQDKRTDPWRTYLFLEDEPTEDELLLMPSKLQGYDLLEKEWVSLPVSSIKPVLWNKQPFEDLVLPEDTKNLVKAMVTLRATTIKTKREKRQTPHADFDLIPGKGNGLIMLFHGSPGTGKTLTAESVAEIAEMPLYPITCGDIGIEPDKVEQYLRLVFMLGKRWNCVLMLDEADVFLEERTLTDLQRNSLVSVFLRMLEYYDGILILTSNRVGTFDEAFRSRIHIALHYEDLGPRSRKQIWNNFLARLESTDEGENVDEIRDRVDELAKHKLNGREIRNALSTARQLASHGGVKMTWDHLKLAIKTVNDFGSYLRNVHGHSDREWAREARTR